MTGFSGIQASPSSRARGLSFFIAFAMFAFLLLAGPPPSHAATPGPNGLIAFHSNRLGSYAVYVMNPDGTTQTAITSNAADDLLPAWSPDGTKIVFQSNRDGNYEIYLMGADGSSQTRLTNNAAEDSFPAWSPDGQKIVFQTNRDGVFQIYSMNADGSAQTRLTNGANDDQLPSWSPNGQTIAFDRNLGTAGDEGREIFVMNADGSGQTRLTYNTALDSDPNWSPDGTKLVFVSRRAGPTEVYSMNANGSGATRLTTSGGFDADPSWSPDGTLIAFSSVRNGQPEIYVMNSDGSAQTRLTSSPGIDGFPDWGTHPLLPPPPPPPPPVIPTKVSPAFTTCQMFRDGTAAQLTTVSYFAKSGKVKTVSGQLVYFSKIAIAPSSFFLDVVQTRDNAAFPFFGVQAAQTGFFSSACARSSKGVITIAPNGSNVHIAVSGATSGEVFYLAVMYNPATVIGTSVTQPYPTVRYGFQTNTNGNPVATNPQSVLLKPAS